MTLKEQKALNERNFLNYKLLGITGAEYLLKYPWLKKYTPAERRRKLPSLAAKELALDMLKDSAEESLKKN